MIGSISSNLISKCNWNFVQSPLRCTTPKTSINFKGLMNEPLQKDTVYINNPTSEINAVLKNSYNIQSELTNPEISKRVLSAVEDFTKINRNKTLFENLKIKQGNLKEGIASVYANPKTKEFELTFNESFDWKNLENITKQMYNKGKIPSDNPMYLLYKSLGEFLNFQHNPYGYIYNKDRNFINETASKALKFSDSTNVSEFNTHYIAGKMSGIYYPEKFNTFFEENGGNINLKFPDTEHPKINSGTVHDFKTVEDSIKYLNEKYGITAEFIDLTQANLFAGAVDDLTKLTGNTDIFRDLKIRIAPDAFDNLKTKMATRSDYKTGKSEILINPAFDWARQDKKMMDDYQAGYHPTYNPKDDYIHELIHYIDFKGNPVEFVKEDNAYKSGKLSFTDYGKSITAKVSSYATNNPAEFHAEYVVGRFNGIKYPDSVNNGFEQTWHGTDLNFDLID